MKICNRSKTCETKEYTEVRSPDLALAGRGYGIKVLKVGQVIKLITKALEMTGMSTVYNSIITTTYR